MIFFSESYSFIERHNLSNPSIRFTGIPDHKLFGFVQYQYADKYFVQINSEYNSERYSTSYGITTGGYAVLNAKASVKIWRFFTAEAGINNMFDKNYSLTEGYPEMGRNYFLNLVYKY